MLEQENQYSLLWKFFKNEFECYKQLPMGVYISALNGTIVKANEKAVELLKLKHDDYEQKASIEPYYVDLRERETIIRRLKDKGHSMWLENETLQFNITIGTSKIRRSFGFFSKSYFLNPADPETLQGSLCLLFEISEIERFRTLEKLIPVGTFEVSGKDMELIYHNQKFDELLLIDADGEEKLQAGAFFSDPEEFEELRKKLENGEKIINRAVRLKKRGNGANILASLSIVPETYDSKLGKRKVLSAKGFIQDITLSKFLEAPIGLYVVTRNAENQEVITWANNEFAKICGHERPEQCLDVKLIDLYRKEERERYEEFLKKYEEDVHKGNFGVDYWLEFTNLKGELKQVFIHAKPVRSEKVSKVDVNPSESAIIGRVGSVIDISDNAKQQLHKEVEEDYAAFLHLFSAFVHDVKTTLISIIRGHSSEVLFNIYDVDLKMAFTQISHSAKRLDLKMTEFLKVAIDRKLIQEPFLFNMKGIINRLLGNLSQIESYTSLYLKGKAVEVRRNLLDIRNRLKTIPALKSEMPSQQRKEVEFEIIEGLRFARLISLWHMTMQAEGMGADLDILSRAINPSADAELEFVSVSLRDVLGDVKSDLAQYAKNERVNIKISAADQPYKINGIIRNLYALFYNLLHNAIKYTWKKPSMMESYVQITLVEKYDQGIGQVAITFENRGDAILKSEMTKILKFGYRGVRAVNELKKGTGVGLWHANKIVKQHKGKIVIESDPILDRANLQEGAEVIKPHITKVTAILPYKIRL